MTQSQTADHDDRFVRRYEYDDHSLLAVDLPVGDEQVDVDVVGSTAILVIDHGDRLSEMEFELPGTDPEVTMNNGVLTVTVDK
ncbi:MAG: Hsp20/alpha crystallin family protein [Euryarchaeota archaeon]|nr:Hsp20/alpha crystallin family protein [Euryarchaeota archaeon]